MKHLRLLAALVEDAEDGSDAIVLKHISDEVRKLVTDSWGELRKAGNECSRYEDAL